MRMQQIHFLIQVQCFKRSKTQKGKVFKARSDEAKLKIGEISPSRNIKEIELFDAATKQKVKRNVGEYNKGDVISYFNLKKNKEYYLLLLNEKSSLRCVKVSYTIDFIKDVTKDYKFYPSYKNGNVYVQLKKVANKKSQAMTGTVTLSKEDKSPIKHTLTNSKQSINLNSFKPFSDSNSKPTKIDIFFKGKIGGKEVKINHSINIVQYKNTKIKKTNNKSNVKITVEMPKGLSHKDGKLQIRLYDQDQNKEVTKVTPSGNGY